LISQNQSVVAVFLFLRPFDLVCRQLVKAVAVSIKLMLLISSDCLILVLSRFVLNFFSQVALSNLALWLIGQKRIGNFLLSCAA
ncbi:hypothetical protein ACR82O_003557, partial [Vibrio cholerae]